MIKYFFFKCLFIIFFVSINYHHLYAVEKKPVFKGPVVPVVKGVSFNDKKKYSYPVKITFAGGRKNRGVIFFSFDKLTINNINGRYYLRQTINISNIKFIKFMDWGKKSVRKNYYIFKPVKVEIKLTNNKMLNCSTINALNSLTFSKIKKSNTHEKIFTVFYDSWVKNRWENSEKADEKYPETHPHKDTVVKIEFIQKKKEAPFNFLKQKFLMK